MLKLGISYFDRLAQVYQDVKFVPFKKEDVAEQLIIAIKQAQNHELDILLNYDVYAVCTLDTKTGEILADKELLVSLTKEAIYGISEDTSK